MLKVMIAALLLLISLIPANAATRVYLFRGLFHLSNFGPLANDLRRTGAVVHIYGWRQRDRVLRDALSHPYDKIIVGGHSQGSVSAVRVGNDMVTRGRPVHVIALDRLCTNPRVGLGLWATNIWGSYCFRQPGTIWGAENIYIRDHSHVRYPTDAAVRAQFVQASEWD